MKSECGRVRVNIGEICGISETDSEQLYTGYT